MNKKCINCKNFKPYLGIDSDFWCSTKKVVFIDIFFKEMKKKTTETFYNNPYDLNKNNNCHLYQKKWWKFWIKK